MPRHIGIRPENLENDSHRLLDNHLWWSRKLSGRISLILSNTERQRTYKKKKQKTLELGEFKGSAAQQSQHPDSFCHWYSPLSRYLLLLFFYNDNLRHYCPVLDISSGRE